MTDRETIVRRFYESLCARDWDAMGSCFADDVEFGLSGRSPFAGDRRGPDAIASVFRDIVDRSGGTFGPVREDTWDICTSEHHVLFLEWLKAERAGKKLSAYIYLTCAVQDGKIKRMFAHFDSQYDFDEFWS